MMLLCNRLHACCPTATGRDVRGFPTCTRSYLGFLFRCCDENAILGVAHSLSATSPTGARQAGSRVRGASHRTPCAQALAHRPHPWRPRCGVQSQAPSPRASVWCLSTGCAADSKCHRVECSRSKPAVSGMCHRWTRPQNRKSRQCRQQAVSHSSGAHVHPHVTCALSP